MITWLPHECLNMPHLYPLRSLIKQKRSAGHIFEDESIRDFRISLASIAEQNGIPVFVFGLWVGFGDLCLEMAFWDALQKKYASHTIYYAIPENKSWVLNAYKPKPPNIIPISKECQMKLENPFLFRKIKSELGDKAVCLYGKIACRGFLLMRGDFRIGLPLLNCYRNSLRLGRKVSPVPMPYTRRHVERKPKKVIFNLYSNSLFLNGSPVWPALFDACVELGLDVVCNQRGVPNRKSEIFVGSIQELRAMYEECVLLVSIRSGIMDFAFGSGINMLAVYPNKKNILKAYTLKQWHQQQETVIEGFEKDIIMNPKAYLIRALEQK